MFFDDIFSDDFGVIKDGPLPTIPKSPLGMINRRRVKEMETINNAAAACNPTLLLIDAVTSMSVREARRRLHKGAHIKCNRIGYSHHGIYDGNGHVFEYNEGIIRLVPLNIFADGDEIVKVNSPTTYSEDEIIRRARSRLGEQRYDLIFNNCEHYARWCRNGNNFYTGPLF